MKVNANSPAYPVLDAHLVEGLTKREWMAATILQGVLAAGNYGESYEDEAARQAVKYTDTLLTELEKKMK